MLFAVLLLLFLFDTCPLSNAQNVEYKTLEEVYVPPTIENDGSQFYNYKFKTSNDIEREENGYISPDENVGSSVRGSYSYVRPDGIKEVVNYVADKDGFRILPKETKLPIPSIKRINPAALASLAG